MRTLGLEGGLEGGRGIEWGWSRGLRLTLELGIGCALIRGRLCLSVSESRELLVANQAFVVPCHLSAEDIVLLVDERLVIVLARNVAVHYRRSRKGPRQPQDRREQPRPLYPRRRRR